MKKPATQPTKRSKRQPRREWVKYLPAIIQAVATLADVLLKHFHP